MNSQKYIEISGLVFIVVAILHLVRASAGWLLVINGYTVPIYVSWIVVVLIGYMAYQSLELKDKKSSSTSSFEIKPVTKKKTTRRKTVRKIVKK
ncbi:MAG: hypothetical protein COV57_03240 [Candidatus Liptonbacteria bacterium CG11_big_fil_rev_8_21_14_0_20_35_14]|uniref:Uncharacterized protein n=1 Tax=Candidatus Liptonbacteria bacterium CG11_big_fil_rev_8_21_14_0_20_35_14 TaxID=1974634 RepID=A0A2H0N6Z3_9BACT|nr:MAG: hypothetical protein COV57_03240 [Candidatus Liptonbacteria bacterium CG11_big_fil_rev_8_21_14_0_20_35_14]